MKTFQYRGQRISWTNTTGSAVASGGVVVILSGTTGYIGIAVDAIAIGAAGEVEVEFVHQLTKNTGEAFTPGQLIYWNATSQYLTGTSTSNTRAGRSDAAYASAATLANVKLNAA